MISEARLFMLRSAVKHWQPYLPDLVTIRVTDLRDLLDAYDEAGNAAALEAAIVKARNLIHIKQAENAAIALDDALARARPPTQERNDNARVS